MRTLNSSTALVMGLVFTIVFGAGCADKDKKKGSGASTTAASIDVAKNFAYTATVKSGVNEVTPDFPGKYFEANEKAKAEGTESLLPGGDVSKAIALTKLGDGARRASKPLFVPNGWTVLKIKNVKDDKVVQVPVTPGSQTMRDVGADISSSPDDQFRYSVKDSAYLLFVHNGKIYARSMEPTITKPASGPREFSLTIVDLSGDKPAGTVELQAVPGGDFTAAKKFEKQADGHLKVTGIVINNDGRLDLQVGYFAGSTLVQGFDLKVLSSAYDYNFDAASSTLSFQIEGTDVYRVGTREDPWAPGNEGQGDLRFEIRTVQDNTGKIPAYRVFRKVERLKDPEKERYLAFVIAPVPQPAEHLLDVDWFPRWRELGSAWNAEWDKEFVGRMYVADSFGAQARRLELPSGNRYLKSGTTDTFRFIPTGKGSVIPSVAIGSSVSDLVLTTPVNVPKQGRGPVKKTVFGKMNGNLVVMAEDGDLVYTAGTVDNQGNFVPAQSGQEMFTAERGGIFTGKIDFGTQKCRIRYSYTTTGQNPQVVNVDLLVDVRVFDFVP